MCLPPEVARDRDAVARARVCARQGPAAHPPVDRQPRGLHRAHIRRALPVPQLAHVEVACLPVDPRGAQPAEHDVAGGLHQPLALHHAAAVVGELALAQERLQHRGLRLLALQEQRVLVVAAQHQHHPRARAHAAHPHHFARQVHVAVVLQQLLAVALQARPVGAQEVVHPLMKFFRLHPWQQVLDTHQQGRVADDLGRAIHRVREPREGARVVLRPGLRGGFAQRLELLRARLRFELRKQAFPIQARVPDVEVVHLREAAHPSAVLLRRRPHSLPALLLGEPALATRDRDARRQALDVPLPRARERLVEVVDVEHQIPLRRGEAAEVRQVRVPAQLRREARARRARQIRGHDVRRAAEERERRGHHPPVTDRDQLRHPRGRLLLQQRDRVRALRPRLPLRVARARRFHARRFAPRAALIRAQVWDLRRGARSAPPRADRRARPALAGLPRALISLSTCHTTANHGPRVGEPTSLPVGETALSRRGAGHVPGPCARLTPL